MFNNYSIYQIDIYDNSGNELPETPNDLSNYPIIDYIDVVNNKILFEMKNSSSLYTEITKPTNWVSIYKDGKEVSKKSGFMPKEELLDWINENV